MSAGEGHPLGKTYEHKFVRLGEYGIGVVRHPRQSAGTYEHVVHEHARDGLRLVQIFTPRHRRVRRREELRTDIERENAENATAP